MANVTTKDEYTFQSLIGILQTMQYDSVLEVYMGFQSLIGILQTIQVISSVFSAIIVSIPYRYSTNGMCRHRANHQIPRFNPL